MCTWEPDDFFHKKRRSKGDSLFAEIVKYIKVVYSLVLVTQQLQVTLTDQWSIGQLGEQTIATSLWYRPSGSKVRTNVLAAHDYDKLYSFKYVYI